MLEAQGVRTGTWDPLFTGLSRCLEEGWVI